MYRPLTLLAEEAFLRSMSESEHDIVLGDDQRDIESAAYKITVQGRAIPSIGSE